MVNWYGKPDPMWTVTKNPPLTCYYLALAASLFGWSEIVLHCAFDPGGGEAILGTYRLARQFCDRPNSCGVPDAVHAGLSGVRHLAHVRHDDAGVLGVGDCVLGRRHGEAGLRTVDRFSGINGTRRGHEILWHLPGAVARRLQLDETTPDGLVGRVFPDTDRVPDCLPVGHVSPARRGAAGGCGKLCCRRKAPGAFPIIHQRPDGAGVYRRMCGGSDSCSRRGYGGDER